MNRDTTPPPSRGGDPRGEVPRAKTPTSPPHELDDDRVELVSWDAPLVPG